MLGAKLRALAKAVAVSTRRDGFFQAIAQHTVWRTATKALSRLQKAFADHSGAWVPDERDLDAAKPSWCGRWKKSGTWRERRESRTR